MTERLWFEDSNGNERIIKDTVKTWDEVNAAIDEFIKMCNINKTNARKQRYGEAYDSKYDHPFIRYYTRIWKQEDGRIKIDVGSHTEFFLWEGEYES